MILTAENYHSNGANEEYLGVSQYKDFCGCMGRPGCEALAIAKISGKWEQEMTTSLLVGSYVDAHFDGTLNTFKAQHSDIFTKAGALKSEYKQAEEIIQRVERDSYFMACVNGQKQVIMQADLFGAKWKIKIDSYHPGKAIVDLKVMKSIREGFWVKDSGRMSFVQYWGYDIQAAVYQEVVRINTGERLPFLLAVASKEKFPDIEVIGFSEKNLSDVLIEVESNIQRILNLKSGVLPADRCGICDYCRFTKVLTGPIHYSEILEKV